MGGPSVPADWYLMLYPLQFQNLNIQHANRGSTVGAECWHEKGWKLDTEDPLAVT